MGISDGLKAYGNALDFMGKHKLYVYLLIPLLFNITIGYFLFSFLDEQSDLFLDWAMGLLPSETDSFILNALIMLLKGTLWLILKIVSVLVMTYVGGYLVLLLLSPVLSYLSEKVERISMGTDYPFSFNQFLKDAFRGVGRSIINISRELMWSIVLFFTAFIPLVNLSTPFLLFTVSSYFYGFSFIDYSCERRKISVSQSRDIMYKNKSAVFGLGMLYCICVSIPIIGFFVGSFVAVISVVAGELLFQKIKTQ